MFCGLLGSRFIPSREMYAQLPVHGPSARIPAMRPWVAAASACRVGVPVVSSCSVVAFWSGASSVLQAPDRLAAARTASIESFMARLVMLEPHIQREPHVAARRIAPELPVGAVGQRLGHLLAF